MSLCEKVSGCQGLYRRGSEKSFGFLGFSELRKKYRDFRVQRASEKVSGFQGLASFRKSIGFQGLASFGKSFGFQGLASFGKSFGFQGLASLGKSFGFQGLASFSKTFGFLGFSDPMIRVQQSDLRVLGFILPHDQGLCKLAKSALRGFFAVQVPQVSLKRGPPGLYIKKGFAVTPGSL